jgi:hypothetical protein
MSSFQIWDGFVDIVGIVDGSGTRTRTDRVAPSQIGHIFGGRYSGGRGKAVWFHDIRYRLCQDIRYTWIG